MKTTKNGYERYMTAEEYSAITTNALKLLSDSMKGENNPVYNVHLDRKYIFTNEVKEKMSKSHLGNIP